MKLFLTMPRQDQTMMIGYPKTRMVNTQNGQNLSPSHLLFFSIQKLSSGGSGGCHFLKHLSYMTIKCTKRGLRFEEPSSFPGCGSTCFLWKHQSHATSGTLLGVISEVNSKAETNARPEWTTALWRAPAGNSDDRFRLGIALWKKASGFINAQGPSLSVEVVAAIQRISRTENSDVTSN